MFEPWTSFGQKSHNSWLSDSSRYWNDSTWTIQDRIKPVYSVGQATKNYTVVIVSRVAVLLVVDIFVRQTASVERPVTVSVRHWSPRTVADSADFVTWTVWVPSIEAMRSASTESADQGSENDGDDESDQGNVDRCLAKSTGPRTVDERCTLGHRCMHTGKQQHAMTCVATTVMQCSLTPSFCLTVS